MSVTSTCNADQRTPEPLLGPNLCSQVGANVSTLLRAALMEMCDHRHGQISYADIDHVFDLVVNSSELFTIYQRGYSKCVTLKTSAQFVRIDESTVMQFVVGAYCRDLVMEVFNDHGRLRSVNWSHTFVQGFANFLVDGVDPEVRRQLFSAYQKLVTKYAASLTPVTILNAEEVVNVFAKTTSAMKARLGSDSNASTELMHVVNEAISAASKFTPSEEDRVTDTECQAFAERLVNPSTKNPFRILVTNAEGGR